MKNTFLYTALWLIGIIGVLSICVVDAWTITYWDTTYTATLTWDNTTMNNFSYKTITVGDYTIMDRNLWATEEW